MKLFTPDFGKRGGTSQQPVVILTERRVAITVDGDCTVGVATCNREVMEPLETLTADGARATMQFALPDKLLRRNTLIFEVGSPTGLDWMIHAIIECDEEDLLPVIADLFGDEGGDGLAALAQ